MTFGIIGYGSFGRLAADVLSGLGEVMVFEHDEEKSSGSDSPRFAAFEKVAESDVIILAVGLDSLEGVSKRLASLVNKNTLVVDVCSVKLKPVEIINKNLDGKCRLLFTHPLFGPQTVQNDSVSGQSIVVCPFDFAGKDKITDFLENKLKLKIIEMSAEEHDKEMAWVHALTFFVGRGLMKLDPPKSTLVTGYYQKLLDLVELESSHSIELFNTVEQGNPFAAKIRRGLIDELNKIDREIGT